MISNMPPAFLDFKAVYLRKHWLEHSSLLNTCTTRMPLTMSQIFYVRKSFATKLLAKKSFGHLVEFD